MSLLRHQLTVSRYLAARVRNQKGLLAIHGLGSGKTRTGIAFAENFPHRVIVICPEGLDYVWLREMKSLGVQRLYEFVRYGELLDFLMTQSLQNTIIIADEAHKIALLLNSQPPDVVIKILKKFHQAKKILLLTGTPIYSSEVDIRWLINIAAGKIVVPINKGDFLNKYYLVRTKTAVVKGWLTPLFASNIPMYVLLYFSALIPLLTYGQFGFSLFQSFQQNPQQFRMAVGISDRPDLLQSQEQQNLIANMVTQTYGDLGMSPEQALTTTIDKPYVEGVIAQLQQLPENTYIRGVINLSENLKSASGLSNNASFIATFLIPLVIMALLTAVALCTRNYRLDEDRVFDTTHFISDVHDYVSLYMPPANSGDFPSSKFIRKKVQYTAKQLDVWIRFTMGQLTVKELTMLEIADSTEEAELFGNIEDFDTYRNKGRLIGNLSFEMDEVPKFLQIRETIGKDYAVIYSNFWNSGSVPIYVYLKAKGVSCALFEPDLSNDEKDDILEAFKAHKLQVIILHPAYTEGLSIQGARQLHIMEPIAEKAKREQVSGRAVRYQSHHHLPLAERNVVIYEWYCSTSQWQDLLNKNKAKLTTWFKDSIDVAYWKRMTTFQQDITPDEIVINRQDELSNTTNKLMSGFQNSSIDLHVPTTDETDDCCVWEPDNVCRHKQPCKEVNW